MKKLTQQKRLPFNGTWKLHSKLIAEDSGKGHESGAASIFKLRNRKWIQSPKLRSEKGGNACHFGATVSVFKNFTCVSSLVSHDEQESIDFPYFFKL